MEYTGITSHTQNYGAVIKLVTRHFKIGWYIFKGEYYRLEGHVKIS